MLRYLLPLALATFAVGTDGFIVAGLLPAVSRDLHISLPVAGQLVTAFSLAFAFSAPVFGVVTSGLNRRTALSLALTVFILGNIGTALATTYPIAMVVRIFTGLGAGMITSTAATTAIAITPPARRGRALGFVMGGLSAATALGAPLGILIGATNWRIAIWEVVAIGVLAFAGIVAVLPKLVLPASTFVQRLTPIRQAWVLYVLMTTVGILAANYFLYTYLGAATRIATGSSEYGFTSVLFVWGLGVLCGTFVAGILCDRFRPEIILMPVLVVTMAMLLISPLAFRHFGTTIVWAYLWGICVGLPVVPQQHRLMSNDPTATPVLLGLNSSAVYVGIAAGSALGGISQQWVTPAELGLPATIVLIVPMTLLFIGRKLKSVPRE
ncbi:MFS transporter [Serratia entomophila]|uniref:MFS transporter n=1 Tax=Serratia entomophila TaxID=42906 RepID=UPI0021C65DA7|nr:MFS transporter [Serratia entomophila]